MNAYLKKERKVGIQPSIRYNVYISDKGVYKVNSKEIEQKIIENYQKDEQMMILIFAQWCVNHDLDPIDVYFRAYPHQSANYALKQTIDLTVPKGESEHIPDQTLLHVLSLYSNEELAFVVTEEIKKRKKVR